MAKNYESESKNTYGNEMDRTENVRSGYETDTTNKTRNKPNDKTSQSYSSEETSRY